VKPVTGAKS